MNTTLGLWGLLVSLMTFTGLAALVLLRLWPDRDATAAAMRRRVQGGPVRLAAPGVAPETTPELLKAQPRPARVAWWRLSSPRQAWQQHRRRKALEAQLPDALDAIARALRAGHGFRSALGLLGQDAPQPLRAAFAQATERIQYGVPMDQALRELADDSGSADMAFFVTAVLIQKDTGGNLADLLATLARLVRARARLRARIRVISAEGRASGLVLGTLPFIMVGLLSLVNPAYVALLWTTAPGQTASLVVLSIMAVGGLWIRQLVQVKA